MSKYFIQSISKTEDFSHISFQLFNLGVLFSLFDLHMFLSESFQALSHISLLFLSNSISVSFSHCFLSLGFSLYLGLKTSADSSHWLQTAAPRPEIVTQILLRVFAGYIERVITQRMIRSSMERYTADAGFPSLQRTHNQTLAVS